MSKEYYITEHPEPIGHGIIVADKEKIVKEHKKLFKQRGIDTSNISEDVVLSDWRIVNWATSLEKQSRHVASECLKEILELQMKRESGEFHINTASAQAVIESIIAKHFYNFFVPVEDKK